MRPATHHEIRQLRERYVMRPEEIKPGVDVQILANGNWPYPGIVLTVGCRLVKVEFQRRKGGHVSRALHFPEIYVAGALERLRSERAAAPGRARRPRSNRPVAAFAPPSRPSGEGSSGG